MASTLPSVFVATPSHDGRVALAWVAGAMQALLAFPGRIAIDQFVGSVLPRNRDVLTARFMASGASHMLCVDSDIGWSAAQLQALLDAGKPFVSGTYCRKDFSRGIPARFTGRREGDEFALLHPAGPRETVRYPLWEAEHVPAGFLLIERSVIERMIGAYRELEYDVPGHGRACALWYPEFRPGVSYPGEDIAFCERWRKLAGEIWMHRGVVLNHYGEIPYVPDNHDLDFVAPSQ